MEAGDPPPPGSAGGDTTAVLLRALGDGDRTVVDALFRRYLPRVRRMVSLRMGKKLQTIHAEEDAVQQSLLRAFRSLPGCRHASVGSFRSWLARCVENELSDLARKGAAEKRGGKHRKVPLEHDDLLATSILERRFSSPRAARRMEEALEDAILSLPPHHREIIVLRFLAGMSHGEIAAEMGFGSEKGSRAALARAMERLRKILEIEGPPPGTR